MGGGGYSIDLYKENRKENGRPCNTLQKWLRFAIASSGPYWQILCRGASGSSFISCFGIGVLRKLVGFLFAALLLAVRDTPEQNKLTLVDCIGLVVGTLSQN